MAIKRACRLFQWFAREPRVMEKRSLVIHPGEIVVEFLEPINASSIPWRATF